MRKKLATWAVLLWLPVASDAAETPISVSVLSNDAKFIGTSMGGALIVIRDVLTGEILVQGKTRGTTGDTKLLMAESRERGAVLRSTESARFDAVLELREPRRVEVSAHGPLAQTQSAVTVTQQRILLPGKDYSAGNGILLSMPGMSVDILKPAAHSVASQDQAGDLLVQANVVKMCGCPLREAGPWPADRYEVEARINHEENDSVSIVPLAFTGTSSLFEARLELSQPGSYEIVVTAFDPKTMDSGVDRTTVILD